MQMIALKDLTQK